MTEDEENELQAFLLFENNVFDYKLTLKNSILDEDRRELINQIIQQKFQIEKKYSDQETKNGSDISILNKNGNKRFTELKNKKLKEDIEKTQGENEKILIRSVNQSTLKTHQSILMMNHYQKVLGLLTLSVAIFASWIAYQQKIKDDVRDAREQLRLQNTKEIQHQINTLQMSLDSMRGFQNTSISTKNP